MSRANSLKKAVRQIIEHTEKTLDDQNAQSTQHLISPEIRLHPSEDDHSKTSNNTFDKHTDGLLQVC